MSRRFAADPWANYVPRDARCKCGRVLDGGKCEVCDAPFCDECDERIEGEIVSEVTRYPNGHVCTETWHPACAAVVAARRAA